MDEKAISMESLRLVVEHVREKYAPGLAPIADEVYERAMAYAEPVPTDYSDKKLSAIAREALAQAILNGEGDNAAKLLYVSEALDSRLHSGGGRASAAGRLVGMSSVGVGPKGQSLEYAARRAAEMDARISDKKPEE